MSRPTPAWFTDFGQRADAPMSVFAFAHAGGVPVCSRIRADLSLVETHAYRERAPLDRPIVVYCGKNDRMIESAEMEGWRTKSSADLRLHPIDAAIFSTSRTKPNCSV